MGSEPPPAPPPPEESTPPDKPDVLNYQTPGAPLQTWVTVFKAQNGPEANLAVMALQEKDIPARVDFENSATLGAWAGAGPGTATGVQVLESDVIAARAIIDEIERRKTARLEAGLLKCPQCGKLGPKRILSGWRWAGITLIVLGFVMAQVHAAFCVPIEVVGIFLLTWPMKPKWRCRSCGHTWRAAEPEEPDDDDEEDETGEQERVDAT